MTEWLMVLMAATGGASQVLEALAPTQGGLTTDQVIERAIATAPSVTKAEAQQASRESDADVAFLGFAPRIDGTANYTRLSPAVFPEDFETSGFETFVPENIFAFRAIASLPVTDYFLISIYRYQAVFSAEEAAQYQTRASREAAALRAVEAYLNTVRARAAELVFQRSVDVLAAQYEDTQQLAKAGLSTEGDALQVKARLASSRLTLLQATGRVQVTREALRRTLHKQDVVLEHGEDLFAPLEQAPLEAEEALKVALAERYEIRALHKVIEGREQQVSFTRGRIFPKLTVDGQVEHSKPNQRFFRQDQQFDTSWLVAVNLVWSPNDAIGAWTETSKAEQEVEAAKADLEELTDQIAVEVMDAVSSYRATQESIGAAQEGVDAAQGTFTDRQNLLNAGEGTTRELLLSEEDLRRAQLQLINAHLDLRLAQARLDRALGRLVKEAKP